MRNLKHVYERRLQPKAVSAILVAIIATVVILAPLTEGWRLGRLEPLEIGAVVALAFLPGWLFVRFLGKRAEALWYEYVLNLHRLRVDEPENLPRPPVTSSYYSRWKESGGEDLQDCPSIYREKFDAYYGKNLAKSVEEQDPRVTTETVFPVLLTTAALAAGWVAVFWGEDLLTTAGRAGDMQQGVASLRVLLVFAFLGAYLFSIQMLVRRFFQGDLRSSAYAHVIVRLVTALLLIPVLQRVPVLNEPLIAFAVGAFPVVGLQALMQMAARPLRVAVPSLRPSYPLHHLDGLTVWYEVRLLEEGIEDMQNLTTANLVDIILHTRVPVGRLVEWVDQAYLYTRLPPKTEGWLGEKLERHRRRAALRSEDHKAEPPHVRDVLRHGGVTNATSLLVAVPAAGSVGGDGQTRRGFVRWVAERADVDASALVILAAVLRQHSGLNPVHSWWAGASKAPRVEMAPLAPTGPSALRDNGKRNQTGEAEDAVGTATAASAQEAG
ncbi:MAG TPA: hypothetical protein VHF25_16115 [Nitriliruptorales bacterium]|nr:hypothetical protein [Nitriliruptorales bacterium]